MHITSVFFNFTVDSYTYPQKRGNVLDYPQLAKRGHLLWLGLQLLYSNTVAGGIGPELSTSVCLRLAVKPL